MIAGHTTARRAATRARLLDAAAQVFAETGVDAASVEAVCERAGFTRGAFYSNFATKEELVLALCARSATLQLELVRERVARFEAGHDPLDPVEIVHDVLDVAGEDRAGVLLLSEIRLHALRTPSLARAYLAQEDALQAEVARIITDLARMRGVRLRVAAPVAARAFLGAWMTASARAVMAGLDDRAMRAALGDALAETAELVIER